MQASLLATTLIALHKIKRSLCIEGAPGGGKTSVVRQTARTMAGLDPVEHMVGSIAVYTGQTNAIGYSEVHLPTKTVDDFGIPDMLTGGETIAYRLFEWFPAIHRTDIPEQGILCFDDRNQASADIQKVLANIIQARTLHGVMLKPGWQVVSTGNRQQDKAGAGRVLSHLRNRESVVAFETSLKDWIAYAEASDVHPYVVSFLRYRPELLHAFDADKPASPTPRSWAEGVAPLIGVVPAESEHELFCGAVGEGAAAEFVGFLRIARSLTSPADIIAKPDTADIPTDTATLYALSGALSSIVVRADTLQDAQFKAGQILRYVNRFASVGRAEFGVITVSSMLKRKDLKAASFPGLPEFFMRNQSMMF